MSDIVSAWCAIDKCTTPATTKTREMYWWHRQQYARTWNKDPFLDNASELEQGIILSAFAARVQTGVFGRGHQVRVLSVTEALLAISKTIQLAQKHSPVYREDQKYILPVKKCRGHAKAGSSINSPIGCTSLCPH
eukprot:9872345-Ditylum_brightwellii.AAC.1